MKYYQSFAEEYRIEKTLERTQYSVLCQGKEEATGQALLLKLWLTTEVGTKEEQTRVREEVAILQSIIHPHLLPVLKVQANAQKVLLISEYAQAGSLNERLGQDHARAFALDEALLIIEQVGQALQELHACGITHGNLTPQAVFFSEPGQVKVGEFRLQSVLASIQDYQHILDENVPHCFYMAPEQFYSTFDTQTDQYALGCLAYKLLTGRVPFTGSARATLLQKHERDEPQALTAINPAVPAHIEAAVLRSLVKNPRQRFNSVQDFLDALDVAGKKKLADQMTVKSPVLDAWSERKDGTGENWEWEVEAHAQVTVEYTSPLVDLAGQTPRPLPVPSDLAGQTPHPLPVLIDLAEHTPRPLPISFDLAKHAPRPLPVPYPLVQAHPGQSTSKRERYLLVPVILLVLALLLLGGKWLFSPGTPGSALQKKASAVSVTPTFVLLTPVTATSAPPMATVVATPTPHPTSAPTAPALLQVPLASFFNNRGIGSAPGEANFDGSGFAYPASQLPSGGLISVQGVKYQFPENAPGANDNIIASSQTIPLTPGKYHQAFLLAAASWGPITGKLTIHYADNFKSTRSIAVRDWYHGPANGLQTINRYSPNSVDPNAVYIYVIPIALDSTRVANALTLPGPQFGPYQNGHIHIFSLTIER